MGIMDKLGFGGSSSGNSTPGSGNTSLQESLEQFLKSPKVEDAKVKMNEAMTKAKETASSVAKKAEEYATKAAESISEQMNTGTTASPQSRQQSSQQQPMSQSAPQQAPEMMPQPEQQQTDEPELTDEEKFHKGQELLQQRQFGEAYMLLNEAAQNGHSMSLNCMGWGNLSGYGMWERDYYRAYNCFIKAALKENMFAMWNLGVMNWLGWGVPQDIKNAIRWFEKAQKLGHATAGELLPVLRKLADLNAPDPSELDVLNYGRELWSHAQYDMAIEFATNAIQKGYRTPQIFLGKAYDGGLGCSMNPAKAIEYFKASAFIDQSLYALGKNYEYGIGVERNYQLALQYYQQAVQAGYPSAQKAVDIVLRKINVTDKITVQQFMSAEYYRQEAEKAEQIGDYSAYARFNLYAARMGHAQAIYSVGYSYRYGMGVRPNLEEARQYFQSALDKGLLSAYRELGLMYEYGNGVEKNEETAYNYYCEARKYALENVDYDIERIFRKRPDLRAAYMEKNPMEEIASQEEQNAIYAFPDGEECFMLANATKAALRMENADQDFYRACTMHVAYEKEYEMSKRNIEQYGIYANVDAQPYIYELDQLIENEKKRETLKQKDLEELDQLFDVSIEKNFYYLALWYLELEAEMGDVAAMVGVAEEYLSGRGSNLVMWVDNFAGDGKAKYNQKAAYEWLIKAKENGNDNADFDLGLMYEEGIYVNKDLICAKRHMERVIANKADVIEDAREALERIKQSMLDQGLEDIGAEEEKEGQRKNVESVEDLPENLDSYFEGIIGLGTVRKQLETIYQSEKIKLLRARVLKDRGEAPTETGEGYNFVLLGNPGTGKTMIARIIAKILYDIGIRTSDVFVEVDRSKLVSDHYGGTEKKVRAYLNDTGNGTLFIDEAHTLFREDSDNDFGQEAIDTLLKEMEDHRGEFSVIMAGYKAPMMNMMKNANSGFASRFTYIIELPDYTEAELLQIAHTLIEQKKYVAEEGVDGAIIKCINRDKIDDTFGNARYIRELVEKAIRNMAVRLNMVDKIEENMLFLLKPEDFWDGEPDETAQTYLAELYGLVGLPAVKKEVQTLTNRIMVQTEMEKRGLKSRNDFGTLHMAFKGNPGTGKTTVARIIGKLYASLGILKRKDVFVECSRATLVGQYQGSTAINVKKAVDSAMGGILFIDEAYSLVKSEGDTFGKEAVDTLVSEMENNRNNLIVIFAGYSRDLDEFFKNNQGLKSRVPIELVFEDYTEEELFEISCKMIAANNYTLNEMSQQKLREFLKKESAKADFGNARGVRNVVEACIRNQNDRIATALCDPETVVTDEMLTVIEEFDIS